MVMSSRNAATSDTSQFDNAIIGEGAFIDPDVTVGFKYRPECGNARIGITMHPPQRHCYIRGC